MNSSKQHRFYSILLRGIIIFVLICPNFTSFISPAQAQDGSSFLVRHDQEQVHCHGWIPGESIRLEVDDPGILINIGQSIL